MASLRKWLVGLVSPGTALAEPKGGRWCLVGNIVEQRYRGEGRSVIKRGTKHFPAGTKVYCFPVQWGDGYEQILVVGRHRGSHRYCRMIVSHRHITNWRAKAVYSPEVLRLMEKRSADRGPVAWKDRGEVDRMLGFVLARERDEKAKRPKDPE